MSLHNPKLTETIICLWVRNRESISLEIITEKYFKELQETQAPCPNTTVFSFLQYNIKL